MAISDVAAKDLVQIFLITAVFDVLLNVLPPPLGATHLRRYFDEHTVLGAALKAGAVGAATLPFIRALHPTRVPSLSGVLVTFAVSGLVGFPLDRSGVLPKLNAHYYRRFARWKTFLTDAASGILVASVYWMLQGHAKPLRVHAIAWTSVLGGYVLAHSLGHARPDDGDTT